MWSDRPHERLLPEAAASRHNNIAELVRLQAACTPNEIAVIHDHRALSYETLDAVSDRIALHLRALGITRESKVGLLMGRTEMLVVSLLAILKAGAAYVPLDPSHPVERLAYIVEDSGVEKILTSRSNPVNFAGRCAKVALLNVEDLSADEAVNQASPLLTDRTDLAYVMYTSGSTGRPKGVMVEQGNLLSFFAAMNQLLGTAPGVWLAVTGVAFDISILELLWPLTRGFTIVVHGEDGVGSMADEIVEHQVTHLQMTPSLARMLTLDGSVFASLARLKQILLGGEVAPASLVIRLRTGFTGALFNLYGPTETTIWSTAFRIHEPEVKIPIGKAVKNTQVFLLDANLAPVPDGETGEIVIGGDGVARGYWNQPELTAEHFVVLPSISPTRLYRTGDMGRLLPDGNIEFVGRMDNQIKLRGQRIELGEIETVLEQHPAISQAVVIPREGTDGSLSLVACLVAHLEVHESAPALRSYLRLHLPDAMIPTAFVYVGSMPLNPNGKIDRKALLAMAQPSPDVPQAAPAQQTNLERLIAQAWREALQLPEVGSDDNFFDLGANSLMMAEVFAKLQNEIGSSASFIDFFQFPTVRKLAHYLADVGLTTGEDKAAQRAKRRRLAARP